MTDMSNPREVTEALGTALGQEDLTNKILSGELTADEAMPLLAGMIDQMMNLLFMPTVQALQYTEFRNPSMRPMVANIVMKDGTVLSIILEASDS